jgi:hypothetical protein
MFWGKGDSSKLSPESRQVLERLRELEESGHIVALTPDQTQDALRAIKFYQSVTATTGMVAGMRNVSYWLAGMVVLWWTSKDAVVAFLKHIMTTSGG